MNHYFIYNAIVLFNSNWSQCSCSTVLEGCSSQFQINSHSCCCSSVASALSTVGAAKPTQAQSQTCTAALPGAIPAPSVMGCSEATPSSFQCFSLQWVCHLIQWQIHLIRLFVTSFGARLLAAAFLSGSMFAICLCTLLFSKNMQRLSSWVF